MSLNQMAQSTPFVRVPYELKGQKRKKIIKNIFKYLIYIKMIFFMHRISLFFLS